jgi:hypothetical protein
MCLVPQLLILMDLITLRISIAFSSFSLIFTKMYVIRLIWITHPVLQTADLICVWFSGFQLRIENLPLIRIAVTFA